MPPKRKQAGDSAPAASTRSTRSSKANSATAKDMTTNAAASSSKGKKTGGRAPARGATATTATPSSNGGEDDVDSDTMEVERPAKKARTAAPKKAATKSKRQAAGRGEAGMEIDDEALPNAPKTAATKSASKAVKHESYSSQRALELFSSYADSDDPTVIGHEGFERLCTDASLPMDGARPIILSWLVGAKEMGNIAQAEWIALTASLKISYIDQLGQAITELDNLLIQSKPPIKASTKKDQDYDRTSYLTYESNPQAAFRKLYQFTFALAKPEQSRNIDMETAIAFWTVLLVPKYPIMVEVLSFISEKGTYRATNKDLWTMMLEFCETVKPNLQDYEADGAWPTLLDDFVLWKKSHTGNGNGVADTMDADH
ncbi:DUF298-domain-containing protein [Pholiota conissans]|uniref:Defective in cullin neddylation protein n=1 Tax=Pholiota conissans TaxID=109636 RepID=A0A9P5ZDC5_9AGAR|nr:DUF298-domain-containing protein [Pholiota conissans]